jgi:hypothetical protein
METRADVGCDHAAPPPDSPDLCVAGRVTSAVDALGDLRSLPLTLAIFFALAIATVAHALSRPFGAAPRTRGVAPDRFHPATRARSRGSRRCLASRDW